MRRVLVVDDDPQLTGALESALGREGYDVVTTGDGLQAVELAATCAPDLVVLDLGLPQLPGLEVLARVRPWLEVPVLVLSGVSQTRTKALALDSGADDFLQKPFGLDELLARLRALDRRVRTDSGPATVHYEGLVVDQAASRVWVDATEVRLTPTEWRLLRALVANPDRLLTHGWLLERVWDQGYGEETRDALRTHVRTLRAKLGDDARDPRFVLTESGSGYRWIARAVATGAEAGSPAAPDAPAGELSGDRHELANAVTALRVAVQLLVRAPEPLPERTVAAHRQLDELARRVSDLVATMQSDDASPDTSPGTAPDVAPEAAEA